MRVLFVSSYPYSEEYTKPTQYMNTRCPAWCDRILMSHTAQTFIRKVSQDVLFLPKNSFFFCKKYLCVALHFYLSYLLIAYICVCMYVF